MKSTIAAIALGGAIGLPMVGAVNTLAPQGITIHSLAYQGGAIIQDRTVNGSGPTFSMAYKATISTPSNPAVAICAGSDGFPYRVGRITVTIPLDEWVNDPGCAERLQDGARYLPCAYWSFANVTTEACGKPFVFREGDLAGAK